MHFNILPSRSSITKQLILMNGKVIYVFKSTIYFQSRNKIRDSVNAAGRQPRTRYVLETKNRVFSCIDYYFFFFRNCEVINVFFFFTGIKTWNRHQSKGIHSEVIYPNYFHVDMCYSTDGVRGKLKNNGRGISQYLAIPVVESMISFIAVKHIINLIALNELTSPLHR